MGNDFLTNRKIFVYKYHLLLIEEENNMLLNPQHKDFYEKVHIKQVQLFSFDNRLSKST